MKPNETPRCRSRSGLSSGEVPQTELELEEILRIAQKPAREWPECVDSVTIYPLGIKTLHEKISALAKEVIRLRRGDFTPEEFQNLCHNLHERPVCAREEFSQGCLQFQEKLFGKEPPCLTEIFFVAMCRGDGTLPKPEKALRGKFFFDLEEAKFRKVLWSGERFEGLGVFRCAMAVVEEVKQTQGGGLKSSHP